MKIKSAPVICAQADSWFGEDINKTGYCSVITKVVQIENIIHYYCGMQELIKPTLIKPADGGVLGS